VQLLPSLAEYRQGPVSRAAQEAPAASDAPDEAYVLRTGPIPADGSVVGNVGVLTASAAAADEPAGTATAEVNDVALLGDLVTADTVRANANAGCTADADGTGSVFEDLRVNGQPVGYTPAPNTVFDLGVAVVILNEQHPAENGRGIVVNAIHVVSTTRGDALFRGDVVVAHAMSSVSCPGAVEPATDDDAADAAAVTFELDATPAVAEPGTKVTAEAVGVLELHGVERPVTIPVAARWSGEVIDLTGSVDIDLADHDIDPPSPKVVSVAATGTIELQLTFGRE